MCGSMVDIQSVAAEIRRGKKDRRRRKKETTGQNIMAPLLHRAAITTYTMLKPEPTFLNFNESLCNVHKRLLDSEKCALYLLCIRLFAEECLIQTTASAARLWWRVVTVAV